MFKVTLYHTSNGGSILYSREVLGIKATLEEAQILAENHRLWLKRDPEHDGIKINENAAERVIYLFRSGPSKKDSRYRIEIVAVTEENITSAARK